jgi:hypothetical protein
MKKWIRRRLSGNANGVQFFSPRVAAGYLGFAGKRNPNPHGVVARMSVRRHEGPSMKETTKKLLPGRLMLVAAFLPFITAAMG